MASESREARVADVHSREELLQRMGGDPALLSDVIGRFLNRCPEAMAQLRAAVSHQDVKNIVHWSHTLRGMVSNFGAARVLQVLLRIETLGRSGTIAPVVDEMPEVESEISVILPALQDIKSTLA